MQQMSRNYQTLLGDVTSLPPPDTKRNCALLNGARAAGEVRVWLWVRTTVRIKEKRACFMMTPDGQRSFCALDVIEAGAPHV